MSNVKSNLAQWYDANPAIRRAWVTEDAPAIRVHVVLEPTPDGGDTLPVWLAHCRRWTSELEALTNRTVRMNHAPGTPDARDGPIIAEVAWRDPWSTP